MIQTSSYRNALRGTRLVLATHNDGKAREISAALSGLGVTVETAGSLGLDAPAETAATFAGNAEIKARAALKATGRPALADDSGLSVPALDGAPGVYTADWAGEPRDYAVAFARLIRELGGTAAVASGTSAAFHCHLCLLVPDAPPLFVEGACSGRLVFPPRGSGGFGYDPVFIPDGESLTFGEMTVAQKARFSHRAAGIRALKEALGLGTFA